tara:strand:- start:846 stop:1067 length:222 start_codon:yes stop_codon:yes gene_type:complete
MNNKPVIKQYLFWWLIATIIFTFYILSDLSGIGLFDLEFSLDYWGVWSQMFIVSNIVTLPITLIIYLIHRFKA